MKLTRRNLRKLLIKEARLLKEGSVKNLVIEIGEAIEDVLEDEEGAYGPFKDIIRSVYPQFVNKVTLNEDLDFIKSILQPNLIAITNAAKAFIKLCLPGIEKIKLL